MRKRARIRMSEFSEVRVNRSNYLMHDGSKRSTILCTMEVKDHLVLSMCCFLDEGKKECNVSGRFLNGTSVGTIGGGLGRTAGSSL